MSLFSALTVSATGMAAERTRAALLVENIANSETTRTPEAALSPQGRRLHHPGGRLGFRQRIGRPIGRFDTFRCARGRHYGRFERPRETLYARPSRRRCQRLCIDAQMNPAEDMVDLVSANRSYQANISAMSAVKDMIQKSIDLLR